MDAGGIFWELFLYIDTLCGDSIGQMATATPHRRDVISSIAVWIYIHLKTQ